MKDADCVAFLQWALPRLGLEWRGFRKVRRQVCRRVAVRLRGLGLADAAAYRERLESDAAEWPALARLCTIPISRFYRDREVLDGLGAAVMPALAEAARRRGAEGLECWSAGCASGEEPYTVALQWRMTLAARFPELGLRVLGTDVDATLLERARACRLPAPLSSPGRAAAPCSGCARRFDSPQDLAFAPVARFAQEACHAYTEIRCTNEGARATQPAPGRAAEQGRARADAAPHGVSPRRSGA